MNAQRPAYDCDTSPYWCSDEDYHHNGRSYGRFIEGGRGYLIEDRNTPRPWLNYLCNDKFASCVSNIGLGFTWLYSSLLRVTKYEHEIDYLPREFEDGREVILRDLDSGEQWQAFRDQDEVCCVHRPGNTLIEAKAYGLRVTMELFVPVEDSGECWIVTIHNMEDRPRRLELILGQTWCFAHFGIHTAEEGIPYLSTPGKTTKTWQQDNALFAETGADDLPTAIFAVFQTAEAGDGKLSEEISERKDGRVFRFPVCRIQRTVNLLPFASEATHVFSGADSEPGSHYTMHRKYADCSVYQEEKTRVQKERTKVDGRVSCTLPEKNIELFLNTWLKNQLFLTFRFVRSGYFGFRDTLQDTWGYTLLDPDASRRNLLRTLSHVRRDGVCPRNFSPFDNNHDLRAFMDSGSWIAQCLVDYVKETGDIAVLHEPIPWLDSEEASPLIDHAWQAIDLLYEKRGMHGLCMTGDGDWNDALEGISKSGDAVSAWLTMALFHAQNLMAELYSYIGNENRSDELLRRSEELREALNTYAWDGDWYVYGFTGSGQPIGSSENFEGRIHLNAQTWAIFTGLADEDKIQSMRRAIAEHLDTEYGPALLAPPYVEEAEEVGRIARLEPGTFENGSIYMHAVAFAIYAELISGHPCKAVDLFTRLLPTNPANFDNRRTSEPYCTGNYYCGPGHPRFGQNFFTWFTGNAAWLLRAGFDEMLGLKPDFDSLKIQPSVPSSWNRFRASRVFRGQVYTFNYERKADKEKPSLMINGVCLPEMRIPAPEHATEHPIEVTVRY